MKNKFLISIFVKNYIKKNKKGSNRMVEPNSLIQINNLNRSKYLNISFSFFNNHADMAEWLMQFFDTECLSGRGARDLARRDNKLIILPNTKSLGVQVPSVSVIYNQEVKNEN